ncbi:TrkA C-terminal domain-containing protein [Psychrobacillus psychrodurans]|uniref:TrkA C-terminal domain-containing protein n=1 Tax=Psychrobacillus TaxID=1221880 RepID=UPI0008E66F9E|nr:TrkA C-terminal domain-containing protein [Psychrobacillus psychrodurans]MCK1996067.1 TrkA C-terminal domain-containing protein [Psychrobacillus psychrodurans]MCZ8539633.1 TrkA C-terminal domain-containing protein [Psychrobacillus psychrodurans]SFM43315.1 TrkA-C domain-containing protein [Psychrobacillus psychrodurans]
MGYVFVIVYLTIILIVIEINTILFTFTGLKKNIARFQVISMLTGTGFTTGESELIIDHPIRRRLGAFLILFGAFSLAVIISAISSILSDEFFTMKIGYVAGTLVLFLFVLKVGKVKNKLTVLFEHELERNFDLQDMTIKDVFLTEENDYLVEVPLHSSSTMIGGKLIEKLNSEEDINVLSIKRGEIVIRKERLNTELQAGDFILMFGDKEVIRRIFKAELKEHEEEIKNEIDRRN